MVYWFVVYLIIAIVAAVVISNVASGKSAEPEAITLSQFGTPVISQAQTRRVLMGNKWIPDPLVADYGNYSSTAIWHYP